MDNLSFKEKIVLKMLIKNNRLGEHSINIGFSLINKISVSILLSNIQFLEEVILKAIIDRNSLEYDIYNFIEDEGVVAMSEDQFEQWEQLKKEITSEYLSSNIYDANNIPREIDITEIFKKNMQEKIENNEIDKNSIDRISKMPVNVLGRYWLPITISLLKESGKRDLLLYAVEKMQTVLINRINQQDISPEEKTIILQSINQNLNRYVRGGIKYEDLVKIYYSIMFNHRYSRIVSLARTGNYGLQHLTVNQIANINLKNAKQIIELAKQRYKDQEFDLNMNSTLYKMYIIFGKQRTIELIEGKYGEISLDNLKIIMNNVDIDNYQIIQMNAEPNYDKYQAALINFLFASGANDINANMKKILSGEISAEQIPLTRLINEWKLYYDFLGGNVTVSDLINLMDTLTEIPILPNEKEIANTIKLAGIEYKEKIAVTYAKMQKRTKSQIPKVKGIAGKYEYELLDLVDPIQMNVGYYTDCCFTYGGVSENSLMHACTNEDSRIFVIKQDGKVVAQSWVWRNGNTVCFDNIEVYGVSERAGSKFWHVYEQASNEILEISQACESEDKKIQLVTIGKGYTGIDLKGKNLVCEKMPLPKENLYTDAKEQVIVATSSDYVKPLEYDVEANYQDERKNVIAVDPQQSSERSIDKLNEHIDKINYSIDPQSFKQCNSCDDYTFAVYGSDWFIAITVDGNIVKKEYSFDERSKLEISNALHMIKEKIKSGELNNNINDVILDNIIEESAAYGK